jgi:hypothetical protein
MSLPGNVSISGTASGNGKFNSSDQGGGGAAGTIHITGTGFGAAPPIIVYTDWSEAATGTMSLTNTGVGTDYELDERWNRTPSIFTAWGRNGMGMFEGGNNEATNNRLTAIKNVFSATPLKNFSCAVSIAVPSGRYFPAANAVNSLPSPASAAIKTIWLVDQPLDSPTKADQIIANWTGGGFNMTGNQAPVNIYGAGGFNFTGWNYFKGRTVSGADPFVDAGTSMFEQANTIDGVTVFTDNTTPAFGAGADTAQYDRVHVGGLGNSNNGNSLDNAQVLIGYVYLAMANDNSVLAEVELRNHATRASATELRLIPPTTWSSTDIYVEVPAYLIDYGFTHYQVTTATGQTFSGAIA